MPSSSVSTTSVSITKNRADPLYAGTTLTLTCQTIISGAVDIPVMVNTTWSRSGVSIPAPGDTRIMESFIPPLGNLLEYESMLELSFLISEDSGQYLCNTTIEPLSTNPFIEAVYVTNTTSINVLSKSLNTPAMMIIILLQYLLLCCVQSLQF